MVGLKPRTIAPQLMAIFEENKGYGIRFSDLYQTLINRQQFHYQGPISNTLKWMLTQEMIVKVSDGVRPRYGIPTVRPNGSKYIIVKGTSIEDKSIEV